MYFSTLFNIRVIGAPGVDIDVRRGSCAEDDGACRLVMCSADDGVEIDSDEDELEDEVITGIWVVPAPFVDVVVAVVVVVVVFVELVGTVDRFGSVFCLLGDDVLTSDGELLLICCCISFI